MKKTYEKPAVVRKASLQRIAAGKGDVPSVTSMPEIEVPPGEDIGDI